MHELKGLIRASVWRHCSRAGGNIAASWATLKHLGQNGYMKIAEELMDTTNKLKEGISKIPVTMSLLPVLRELRRKKSGRTYVVCIVISRLVLH